MPKTSRHLLETQSRSLDVRRWGVPRIQPLTWLVWGKSRATGRLCRVSVQPGPMFKDVAKKGRHNHRRDAVQMTESEYEDEVMMTSA